jgi:hypothetical protein
MVDYGIVNEEAWERVEEFRIGVRVESDHLEITLRKRKGEKNRIHKNLQKCKIKHLVSRKV